MHFYRITVNDTTSRNSLCNHSGFSVDFRSSRQRQVFTHRLRRSVPHGRVFQVSRQGQRGSFLVARQESSHVRAHEIADYHSDNLGRHAQTLAGGYDAIVRHWKIGRTDGKSRP